MGRLSEPQDLERRHPDTHLSHSPCSSCTEDVSRSSLMRRWHTIGTLMSCPPPPRTSFSITFDPLSPPLIVVTLTKTSHLHSQLAIGRLRRITQHILHAPWIWNIRAVSSKVYQFRAPSRPLNPYRVDSTSLRFLSCIQLYVLPVLCGFLIHLSSYSRIIDSFSMHDGRLESFELHEDGVARGKWYDSRFLLRAAPVFAFETREG
ncbi:hypothetical protein Hypma_004259 [Hypsizygus marmoreus]|uniref:Uncharacterized protein n=1 Tax=Hypsizygus marmoreus TaxID=39966 RepID=A0A369J7M0_HYPMA|nr:hypothetical protein Hypma_004259 [Hypsizygus marmoreus]